MSTSNFAEIASRSEFAFSCRPYNGKGLPERELIKQACLEALREVNDRD